MFHALGVWARGFRAGLSRPGRLRRAVFTIAIFLVWALVRTIVSLGRGLDHVVFPRFRRQEIREPVYIIGAPRSGTTFLHELLALDEDRFTSPRLYETLLPSIVLCRAVEALGAIDRAIGRPLGRLAGAVERRAFGGWDEVHETAFSRHEEPEGLWVLRMATPAGYLLFPFFDELPDLASLDRVRSDRARRSAVDFYLGSLKRHLYLRRRVPAEGREDSAGEAERTLLIKTVLFFGRVEAVTSAIPDIRFVHASRDPRATIPSALSMFTAPWKAHSPALVGPGPETRRFAGLLMSAYSVYEELRAATPRERWVDVEFEDLVTRPSDTISRIYGHLGLELDEALAERVRGHAEAARSRPRRHAYALADFGLTETDVVVGPRVPRRTVGREPEDARGP